ncbi:CMP-N-acetylneuraminic acid synthetase [Ureibacillus sp. FSL K6-8385]|uniref:CMP-N-acetylneuraminic acid synthetase n=1 Tax=Ureibacillus terrenus TaxID=118246 RepID=A0A540V5J8_9BACL|nr:CMP-N-acetylneuraminic acid synthetase [Ureibacillus terrenus]MED3764274.1 CMP-N-acetylneuraminic acid synthetase [Ureibacillus terrenus]TQE92040.1 CMP-N-acetylneuraminic acid synthetase [Ureibacillus terrenus]
MQNELSKKPKKKIAFIVEYSAMKGYYPFERASILAKLLKEEEVTVFLKKPSDEALEIFTDAQLSPIIYIHIDELINHLKELQPDLIVQDGKDTTIEYVETIRPFCKTLVHFDDFGEGAELADGNILAILDEMRETTAQNILAGSFAFAIGDTLKSIAESRVSNELSDPPHIVVAYEDGDPNNLTYRTLRHLTHLQIPLKVTIAIDREYPHSVSDLQLMALSRRNTKIFKDDKPLEKLLPEADIVICNANYTPYKVAAVGIPCIVSAQNERELNNIFPRENNGFINLGLGRKMKQSNIQNAVMELLLHEARRERAVRKQIQLEIHENNETLKSLLLDFAYERHNIVSF